MYWLVNTNADIWNGDQKLWGNRIQSNVKVFVKSRESMCVCECYFFLFCFENEKISSRFNDFFCNLLCFFLLLCVLSCIFYLILLFVFGLIITN